VRDNIVLKGEKLRKPCVTRVATVNLGAKDILTSIMIGRAKPNISVLRVRGKCLQQFRWGIVFHQPFRIVPEKRISGSGASAPPIVVIGREEAIVVKGIHLCSIINLAKVRSTHCLISPIPHREINGGAYPYECDANPYRNQAFH
jgi:hypothetical protein